MWLSKSIASVVTLLALLGCNKDKPEPVSEMQCIPAVYLTNYCPTKTETHLVRLLKPTPYATRQESSSQGNEIYVAAVINLPHSLAKRDTVFQLQFHYDPQAERQNKAHGYCNTNIAPAKMIVYDGVSEVECP
ncbi:hypothetical protein SAMN05216327_109265 [Dyadobacter sp. SG02]|uniref:hypothetical protein n=1 Tax=Dyadobacter sp. SG02 TaxID=1855291 RepID=UPI0008B2B427|nr:hypothetical protein [Dyadobacter sp. SG02]SEJ40077.1 hypothetical protein SAMN05216327_109265 [Dyadobacter sp. SG02]